MQLRIIWLKFAENLLKMQKIGLSRGHVSLHPLDPLMIMEIREWGGGGLYHPDSPVNGKEKDSNPKMAM